MQSLIDFFAFRTLVSLDVLRLMYAVGALGMPLLAWGVWLWLGRFRLWRWMRATTADVARNVLPLRWRLAGLMMFVLGLFCMELAWRMMCEFLLAYLQMRDALQWMAHRAGMP